MRKLFQPREAREKLRGMGGIMSSSPQLSSTVAKFNVGGPIQAMPPQRSDLGGAMPLASAIHEPSGMMYGEMSPQQLSALANGGDRLAAEILMMLQPPVDAQPPAVAPEPTVGLPPAGTRFSIEDMNPAQQEEFLTLTPEQQANVLSYGAPDLTDTRETAGESNAMDMIAGESRRLYESSTQPEAAVPSVVDGPSEGLEEITEENLMPPEREVVGTGGTAAGADLDFNDPRTYDTDFDEMMRRLGGATGKEDKGGRQKAMADLAMIGLAIAAGQSPDALTNIAQGALTGMQAIRAEGAAKEAVEAETRALAAKLATDREIARIRVPSGGGTYTPERLYQQNLNAILANPDMFDVFTGDAVDPVKTRRLATELSQRGEALPAAGRIVEQDGVRYQEQPDGTFQQLES
jgi:hypothetical protein